MTVSAALAVVEFAHRNGIPRDTIVNTFTFAVDALSSMAVVDAALGDDIVAFYNTPNTTQKVAWYMNYCIDRGTNLSKIKWYNLDGHLDGTPHGSPAHIRLWTLDNAGGALGHMPAEVAACLSFNSDYGTDPEESGGTRPRARDRGRVYIPVNAGALGEITGFGNLEFLPAFRVDLTVAAKRLHDQANAEAPAASWCVWSRKNAQIHEAVQAWVDNAPDIQRRRGFKPTVRTTTTF